MRELTSLEQKFILHWGEMGSEWGINRTVAQIHALLMLSEEPIHAEDISTTLGIARSNTSNSLKELMDWGIVKTIHKLGDRRDYFETLPDVWELFWAIADRKIQKALKPTVGFLYECLQEMEKDAKTTHAYTRQKLSALHAFTKALIGFYERVRMFPTELLSRIISADKLLDALKPILGR